MTDVLKSVKKIFTVTVVGATMIWALGLSTLAPVANASVCPSFNVGDMIKVSGKAAIYSVDKNLKVLYFPSGDEFKSWNTGETYGGYITVSQACFDSLAVPSSYPGAVNFRPGSWVVKRPSSDQLYVVEPGNKLAKISTTDAAALYGANYRVMTVADAFWPHYVNRGTDIAGMVHEGMLVSKDGKTWYVDAGNVLREVTATGMTANRFKAAFVRTVPASYLTGTTVGTAITALETAISNRTQDGAITTAPVTGGNLSVTLAADNPAAGNIADGSAYNKVLKLNLSASALTNVTGITLTKTGLIANSSITGVSVWDAQGNRHGDVMSSLTSDNKITVSFGSYPIVVGAGSSETLTVAVNISPLANSGLAGFSVGSAAEVMSNGTVGGSFPIVGNQMAIIDGNASLASTTITGVAVGGSATQPLSTAAGNLQIGDLQKEVAKFKFSEVSGNEDVSISKLTFYVSGSVQDTDLANITVYAPSGEKLGMAAAMSNRYVTVNFTTPYLLPKSTSRDLSVRTDVVNGSTHAFKFNIQSDYDVMMRGVTTGFYVLPANFSSTVSSTNGWFNMGSGTLSLTKAANSTSGNISSGAQDVVLARFEVKSNGESFEARKMGVMVSTAGTSGASKNLVGNLIVRDATDRTVYMTLAGSTAGLYSSGVQQSLSTYLNLTAGQTKTLEVVGSIDATATGAQKYTVGIGNFYGKRLSTLDFVDGQPSTSNNSVVGNQLTVNPTSLSCYKDTSLGDVTRAAGSTAVIGQYVCSAGSSEDVRLTSVNVAFGGLGQVSNMFQNLSLWKTATGTTAMQLGTTQSVVASTSNMFSFDVTIPRSQTVTLQLSAYVVPNVTGTVSSSFSSYSYTGVASSNSGTGDAVNGQSITVGSGTLNLSTVSDETTISRVYPAGAQNVQVAKVRAAAANSALSLNKITFQTILSGGTVVTNLGTFGTLSLWDGANKLDDGSYVNGDVVFDGFVLSVPMNGFKNLVVKANINDSGTITNNTPVTFVVKSDSQTDIEVTSDGGAYLGTAQINSGYASSTGPAEVRFATGTSYLFHDAYPVISSQALNNNTLDVSSQEQIFRFSVSNPGTVELRLASLTTTVSVSGLSGGSISGFELHQDNNGSVGQLLATSTVSMTSSTGSSAVVFNANNQVNGLLNNLTVGPGSTRTFIVTANTNSMVISNGSTATLNARIAGTTGWTGSAWSTGDMVYYYTSSGQQTEQGPFTATDSYEVLGPSVTAVR